MTRNPKANIVSVIGLLLALLCVLPIAAQPTSLQEFNPSARRHMTEDRLTRIDEITNQIKSDKSNVALYKKRLELYKDLFELNYDNPDWFIYADKFENDLSRLIELERTAEAYLRKGGWLAIRFVYSAPLFPYPAPNKISELYPRNRYFDDATAHFLKAIKLTSDARILQSIYANLSYIYSMRPHLLVSAPDFPKWKNKILRKLVRRDFDASIKYRLLALQAAANSSSDREAFKQLVFSTYLANAETAAKLGDSETALKFTQAAQKYR